MCIQECYRSVTAWSVTEVLPSSFWSKSQSAWPVLSNCCRQPCPSVGMTFSPPPASSATTTAQAASVMLRKTACGLYYIKSFSEMTAQNQKKGGGRKKRNVRRSCAFFIIWATREAHEYWSGQPFPSPGDLPDPGIKLGSPALQPYFLPAELSRKPHRDYRIL